MGDDLCGKLKKPYPAVSCLDESLKSQISLLLDFFGAVLGVGSAHCDIRLDG